LSGLRGFQHPAKTRPVDIHTLIVGRDITGLDAFGM